MLTGFDLAQHRLLQLLRALRGRSGAWGGLRGRCLTSRYPQALGSRLSLHFSLRSCWQESFAETTILQRLPFSSACHSPAPAILQRLLFSSACHSPATTTLQRLLFSSDYHSPATAILQRLPFSSDCHSPAPTILQRLPFSSAYHSPATAILLSTILPGNYQHLQHPQALNRPR